MNDSSLKSLSLSFQGPPLKLIALSPPFQKSILSYTANAESKTEFLIVNAVPTEADAFSQVQGLNKDGHLPLNHGINLVKIRVEAPDASFSIVSIEVLRPGAAEVGLAAISLPPSSCLIPAFSRLETNYTVQVPPEMEKFPISITPLNLNSKVVQITGNPLLPLMVGDTVNEFELTAENGVDKANYIITIRKEKVGLRPKLTQPESIYKLSCSICHMILFQPRKPKIFNCDHLFCSSCLETVVFSKTVGSNTIWTCPLEKDEEETSKSTTINPVLASGKDLEESLAQLTVICPYSCTEKISYNNLATHALNTCLLRPVLVMCSECHQFGNKKDFQDVLKHKTTCVYNCPICFKMVATVDQTLHESLCGKFKADLPSGLDKISDWEKALNSSKTPYSSEKVANAISQFENSFEKSSQDCLLAAGRGHFPPFLTGLEVAEGLLAQAINQDVESAKLKKVVGNSRLHYDLGRVMLFRYKSDHYFPKKVAKHSGLATAAAANENEAAKDSFMVDEVAGLLLQLGIPPNASDAVKLKAIEGEYHNLKNAQKLDQASEVNSFISWMTGKMKGGGEWGE